MRSSRRDVRTSGRFQDTPARILRCIRLRLIPWSVARRQGTAGIAHGCSRICQKVDRKRSKIQPYLRRGRSLGVAIQHRAHVLAVTQLCSMTPRKNARRPCAGDARSPAPTRRLLPQARGTTSPSRLPSHRGRKDFRYGHYWRTTNLPVTLSGPWLSRAKYTPGLSDPAPPIRTSCVPADSPSSASRT